MASRKNKSRGKVDPPAAMSGIGDGPYDLTSLGDLDRLLNLSPAALREKLSASVKDGAVGRDVATELATLEALRPQYESIEKFAARASVTIPKKLQTILRGKKIKTLSDIVEAGGIRHLPGMGALKDDPAVASLDTLAEFSLLPDGMEVGLPLYRAGYTGIVDLSRKSPKALTKSLEGKIDPETAMRLREAAIQESRIALNFVTGQMVTGQLNLNLLGGQFAFLADVCHCCSDAGNPLAYLADLLDYTVRHVSYSGNAVDLAFLKSRLHQPFGDLPVQCADDTEVLRQVRICIEVLRDMLPAPQKTATPREYLETAYRRFLELFGTSFEEIRALPAMSPADGDALAISLQVRNAARLGDLRRDPDAAAGSALQITEAWLEQTFGLRDTTRSPLDPTLNSPWALTARLDYWHRKWRVDDADDTKSPLGAYPLLDPDIVDLADLADLPAPRWQTITNRTQWSALDFIDARRHWIDTCVGTLNSFRKPPGAPALTFAQMLVALAQPLTVPDVAVAVTADLLHVNDPLKLLIVLRQRRERQIDISSWLSQVQLSDEEFELLSRMAVVEARGQAITETEWSDFNAVIVQRAKKLEVLVSWRNEERNASSPISLSPQLFHLRATIDAPDWTPTAWRSDASLRRKWELALRGRLAQEHAMSDEVQAAIDAVEHELLVVLRDDRLRAAASAGLLGGGAGLLTRERQRWFTANLLIDSETSDCAKTTRVEQAIKTVQGLLFGIRNGLLEDIAWDIDDPDFDATWQWLGTYSTWSAAMQIFLHPQRALRPTLRKNQSPGFAAMVEACRSAGRLTPEAIRAIAAEYQHYFLDVCHLVPAAASAGGVPTKTHFVIGRSSVSVAFMFSSWTEAAGFGTTGAPDQTPWTYLEWDSSLQAKVRVSEQEIASVVPFCDPLGQRGVAVYARLRSVNQVDWAKAVWLGGSATPFSGCDAPPPLVLTDQQHVLPMAGGAGGNAQAAWSLDTADVMVPLHTVTSGAVRILVRAGRSSGGNRRFGLVRSDGARLALAASVELNEAWSIPEPASPVVIGQRVLVVNYSSSQIGWIDFAGDQLSLVLTASQVNGSAGTWPVALGGATRRTVFRAVNLDGGGLRLLAFEYVDPPAPDRWLSPVRTFVNVFWLATNGLSFYHREALDLEYVSSPSPNNSWNYYPDNGSPPDGVRWEKFTVIHSGFGPSGSSDASRDDVLVHAPVRTEKYAGSLTDRRAEQYTAHGTNSVTVQALLRWDANNAKFVVSDIHWTISQEGNALAIFGAGSGQDWQVREDDQYLPVTAGFAANRRDRLLAFNPTTRKLALLAFGSMGRLQTMFLADGEMRDSSGQAWEIAADDRLFVGRFLAPGSAAAILTNFSSANVCVLDIRADSLVPVFSRADYRVESPGSHGMYMRPAGAYDAMCIDIDNDGLDEVILKSGSAAQLPGYSIWHGLPGQFATVGGAVHFGGPTGVTEFEVLPMGASARQRQDRAERIRLAYQQNSIPGRDQNLLYLDEAYYFVAVEAAIRLHDAGGLQAALDAIRTVYDYEATGAARLVSYKLVLDAGPPSYARALDWLRDPLSPHAIAEARMGAYQTYTRLLAARFLLDHGDAEFTLATPESVNLAREIYLKTLNLLPGPAPSSLKDACAGLLGKLAVTIGEDSWILPQLHTIAGGVRSRSALTQAVAEVAKLAASDAAPSAKWGGMLNALKKAAHAGPDTALKQTIEAARNSAAAVLLRNLAATKGGKAAWVHLEVPEPAKYVPAPSMAWCIREDAEEDMLRQRAENNLRKIRNCLNIAGLELPYERIAAERLDLGNVENAAQLRALTMPRLTPLPYRYESLIERAKQLAELARQIEQSMLASLQYADQKRFELLKARQDMSLTRAGVRLRDLQVQQADSARVGAELQRDQTQLEVDEYDGRLRAGRSFNEQLSLDLQAGAFALQTASAAAAFAGMASPQTFFQWAGAAAGPLGSAAQAASMGSQLASHYASLENQERELRFKSTLSRQNLRIGTQNIESARDGVNIAMQERSIAQTHVRYAEEVLDFLDTGQFGTLALYEWMSGILEGVYRFFLQQATSVTRMAAAQLEAKTQASIPVTIRDDYAVPLVTGMSSAAPGESQAFDSKGLTGSAQLQRDIYALDQYAFQINKRKLQLVETLSLAQLDAVAFQRFRDVGVLRFDTPMNLYDRRFPGHYLRLIHRVRISLVALIPTTTGIRATLSTSGISRVVIGDDMFSMKTVRRAPESVALSSAWNATGYFELDPQPELLAFAEGAGVDCRWQLEMARAANPSVNYDSIADVLFTLEYTAFNSPDYKRIVVKDLPRDLAGDRAFSFRNDFADAWYELNNPDVCATPLTITFDVREDDFPPNIDKATLLSRQLALYFVPSQPGTSLSILRFKLTEPGGTSPANYRQLDATGVASTRRGMTLPVGAGPAGTWELEINDSTASRKLFSDGKVKDILFVVSWEGTLPPWPMQ